MTEFSNSIVFFSEYNVGTELPSDDFIELEILQNWLKFKELNLDRSNYSLERTQSIIFFHLIELPIVENKFIELVVTYSQLYPYGGKDDFISATLGYTTLVLNKFIAINNIYFNPYPTPPHIKKDVYSCDEFHKGKIVDFVVEPGTDLNFYKQYYKKIIAVINNLDVDGTIENLKLIPPLHPTIPNSEKDGVRHIKKESNKLTVKQIALIHVFKGKQITRTNADVIIAEYGYKSGEGLFQDFNLFSSQTNRKGRPNPFSNKKLENKIQLFESIIEYLPYEAQERVKDEIRILRTYKNKDF